jgi:hypothetical protein
MHKTLSYMVRQISKLWSCWLLRRTHLNLITLILQRYGIPSLKYFSESYREINSEPYYFIVYVSGGTNMEVWYVMDEVLQVFFEWICNLSQFKSLVQFLHVLLEEDIQMQQIKSWSHMFTLLSLRPYSCQPAVHGSDRLGELRASKLRIDGINWIRWSLILEKDSSKSDRIQEEVKRV